MTVNPVTLGLPKYPMEELARIRGELLQTGTQVYDFGTGDPQIPVWEPIRKAIRNAIGEKSQYPTVRGSEDLNQSIWSYLQRRLQIRSDLGLSLLPTNGSKEAIFHVALSLVGRLDRKTIAYPIPGYPVYKNSIEFAGGIAHAIPLREENSYLMQPWDLPQSVVADLAALWINYPNNPTGAHADRQYLEKLYNWCQERNIVLLSDECYIDIYRTDSPQPTSLVSFADQGFLSFMSLSKRSGLTGYRSGFMIGSTSLISPMTKARANFGVSTPDHIQAGAAIAWNDDEHVDFRNEIFTERLGLAADSLLRLGLIDAVPGSTFYLWCRVPSSYENDDLNFCLSLAKQGVITTPSRWLGDGIHGYFRMAMVPSVEDTKQAMKKIEAFVNQAEGN